MAKTTPDFISIPSKSHTWILWIGGLGCLYPSQLFLGNLFVEGWLQFEQLIFGLLFLGFSLACFYFIFAMNTHFFYQDRFVSEAFWGYQKQTVFFKDIESWTEIEKENKHSKWKDLRVYTKNDEMCFVSTVDSEYNKIRQRVTKRKKRNRQAEKNWFQQNTIYYCIGFSLFGLLIISFGLSTSSKDYQPPTITDLQEITGPIDQFELKEASGRRGRSTTSWLELKLQNHPKFDFEIIGTAYRSTNIGGALSNISKSEQVSILILKSEYEMKISKTKKPDFWTRHFYDYTLDIYQLKDDSKTYLDLKDYTFQRAKTPEKAWVKICTLLFGFGFIVASVYIYWTMKKELPSFQGTKK